MNTVKINGHKVELFDSIDEMPIKRFHLYNKYLLIDAGIGGDMQAADSHIGHMYKYAAAKDYDKLTVTLENFRQSVYFVLDNINPQYMAFVCLIKSIDGKDLSTDKEYNLSDEKIKETVKWFSKQGAKVGWIASLLNGIKKKTKKSYRFTFQRFSTAPMKRKVYPRFSKERCWSWIK